MEFIIPTLLLHCVYVLAFGVRIRNFHFINDKRWNWNTAPEWIDDKIVECLLFKKEHGLALDGMHPGRKAHKKYAKAIYDFIIDQSK